jgi:hypothetical protein
VFHFVRRIYEVCTRLAIFDTQIALRPVETIHFENEQYHGIWYQEHDESVSQEKKVKDLWSSVHNNRSFWFTPSSLANLIAAVGFSSFHECLNPHHALPQDRRAYIAIKGPVAEVLSSPKTAAMGFAPRPEIMLPPVQSNHGPVYRLAKRAIPQPIKDILKPLLRMARLLPADTTPSYAKDK